MFEFDLEDCYLIYNTLVIDEPVIWTGLRLIMEEGSKININATGQLELFNSYLTGCGNIWHGLAVSAGGTVMAENNRIEDAL